MKSSPIDARKDPVLTAAMKPASAASSPDSMWAVMITRFVGTPDSFAAVRFDPVTRSRRPSRLLAYM